MPTRDLNLFLVHLTPPSLSLIVLLPYKIEDGMGDFLPPAALMVIAEDYQQGLLDCLNEKIKGASLSHIFWCLCTYKCSL